MSDGHSTKRYPSYENLPLQFSQRPCVATTVGLGAGAVVGVSITIFLLSFTVGTLLAAFICGLRWRGKTSRKPHTSPSEGPQSSPVYEVVEEQPVDILELKKNIAYGPVSH